jgi:hypothetical protein
LPKNSFLAQRLLQTIDHQAQKEDFRWQYHY